MVALFRVSQVCWQVLSPGALITQYSDIVTAEKLTEINPIVNWLIINSDLTNAKRHYIDNVRKTVGYISLNYEFKCKENRYIAGKVLPAESRGTQWFQWECWRSCVRETNQYCVRYIGACTAPRHPGAELELTQKTTPTTFGELVIRNFDMF